MNRFWIVGLALAALAWPLVLVGAPAKTRHKTPIATKTSKPVPTMAPIATPTPEVVWSWEKWFKDNASFKDKGAYLYFAWFAQDAKAQLESGDKRMNCAKAAVELVSRLGPQEPAGAIVKSDLAYIMELDSYGKPKWDSLRKLAHFEGTLGAIRGLAAKPQPWKDDDLKAAFTSFEIFNP